GNYDGPSAIPNESGSKFSLVGPNVQANSSFVCSGGNGRIQSETAIAYSGHTIVVGYNDFRGFYCPGNGFQVTGWAYSVDRGQTFTDGGSLPGGTAHRGDPWLATHPDGSIYLADLWNGTGAMSVTKGTPTDSGVSWGNPVVISGGSFDKEAMTIDPTSGAIYVTYTRLSSGIYMYRSTDGGATFQGAFPVRANPNTQGSAPAVGPNGELYVTWQVNPGSFTSPIGVGFARSFDGGNTFDVFPQVAT